MNDHNNPVNGRLELPDNSEVFCKDGYWRHALPNGMVSKVNKGEVIKLLIAALTRARAYQSGQPGAAPTNTLPIGHTQRGFAMAEFTDHYGHECSLQESSLATDYCIWLGVDKPELMRCVQGKGWEKIPLPEGASIIPSRMHLTREMVANLLPALQHFVETGELPAPAQNGGG